MVASKISEKDLEFFEEHGYLLLENVFSQSSMDALNREIDRISRLDGPAFFKEPNGAIRTIFSPEDVSQVIGELIHDEKIMDVLRPLFKEPFYLFQSKFNCKKSLQSGSWPWHQDFTFWKDDGMPEAKAITVAIYLSSVSDFSGPILCVPG